MGILDDIVEQNKSVNYYVTPGIKASNFYSDKNKIKERQEELLRRQQIAFRQLLEKNPDWLRSVPSEYTIDNDPLVLANGTVTGYNYGSGYYRDEPKDTFEYKESPRVSVRIPILPKGKENLSNEQLDELASVLWHERFHIPDSNWEFSLDPTYRRDRYLQGDWFSIFDEITGRLNADREAVTSTDIPQAYSNMRPSGQYEELAAAMVGQNKGIFDFDADEWKYENHDSKRTPRYSTIKGIPLARLKRYILQHMPSLWERRIRNEEEFE